MAYFTTKIIVTLQQNKLYTFCKNQLIRLGQMLQFDTKFVDFGSYKHEIETKLTVFEH